MSVPKGSLKLDTQSLWCKYEDIAMHFNDLIHQLRMRSLAGVAAVATVVSLFTDGSDGAVAIDWLVASGLFLAVTLVWLAIFCLDYFYYSRLLSGAVQACEAIEKETKAGREITEINLSTMVETKVKSGKRSGPLGVFLFYGIVFAFVFAATIFCLRMSYLEEEPPTEAKPVPESSATPTLT